MEFNCFYLLMTFIIIYIFIQFQLLFLLMMLSILYFNDLNNMMEYSKIFFYFFNKTPLSLAISSEKPELVELILSHKEVDVNTKLILKQIFVLM